jgi:hypothetical protein
MMVVHLVIGVAVVACGIVAAFSYVAGWPAVKPATVAGWAIALLVVQAATGMFLLTATEEGPGPWHIALPLFGLGIVALARAARSGRSATQDGVLAVAYGVAAAASAFALITGIVAA